MSAKYVERFGNSYATGQMEQCVEEALEKLIAIEIERIVSLKASEKLSVREDLLVMFVEMYTRRFALPAFMLLYGRPPTSDDLPWIILRLYVCLVGRAMDDLSDGDSMMFSDSDSRMLCARYLELLEASLPGETFAQFRHLLEKSCIPPDDERSPADFADLRRDVSYRISYYLYDPAGNENVAGCQDLETYSAILLSYLDLNDVIADGPEGPSSTRVSRAFWNELRNDEGKLLFDLQFLRTWHRYHGLISRENTRLIQRLESQGQFYVVHILSEASRNREWARHMGLYVADTSASL